MTDWKRVKLPDAVAQGANEEKPRAGFRTEWQWFYHDSNGEHDYELSLTGMRTNKRQTWEKGKRRT